MCESCGCHQPAQPHEHPHTHAHGGEEAPYSALALNQRYADENRGYFRAKGWRVLNLLSSPGSGKTALLERTLRELSGGAAIVGDLATENDADRLKKSGAPAIQLLTGSACHLDAHMVAHALEKLPAEGIRYLFIENVGNLVCPAAFDLGEGKRVVLLSVTEGEDKPLKYPVAFVDADIVLVTKVDLADAVGFDREAALPAIRQAAPRAEIIELSSRTGDGFQHWLDWLATL